MNNQFLVFSSKALHVTSWVLWITTSMLVFVAVQIGITDDPTVLDWMQLDETGITISTHAASSPSPDSSDKWGIILRILLISSKLFVVIFMLRFSRKITQSINSFDTFHKTNIQSLRTIGHLFIVLFLLGLVGFDKSEIGYTVTLSFDLFPLLGTLATYILAEVFKEGNNLMEENKLTI